MPTPWFGLEKSLCFAHQYFDLFFIPKFGFHHCNISRPRLAWDGKEVVSVGEGEEEGLAGSVELGDPDLAWGPTLLVKLQVWWGRIWFIVSL